MGVYDSPIFYEFNADACVGRWDMPTLKPVMAQPKTMVGFNYARSYKETTSGVCIHFFLDDVVFERVWNRPMDNVNVLKKYDYVLTPDFSLYRNMPQPMMLWNIFRSRLFGQLCQRHGLTVIPTVSWADESSFDYCFDGLPVGGTLCISTVGLARERSAWGIFGRGVLEMCKRCKPKLILCYGEGDIPAQDIDNRDYIQGCPVVRYPSFAFRRWNARGRKR